MDSKVVVTDIDQANSSFSSISHLQLQEKCGQISLASFWKSKSLTHTFISDLLSLKLKCHILLLYSKVLIDIFSLPKK